MTTVAAIDLPGADARDNPIRVAVWCVYEDIVKDGYLFHHPDAGLGANLLKGWCDLYAYGQGHGFDFFTFDQVQDWDRIDAILLCDRPLPGNPLVETAMASRATKYLITAECPIIYPPSWDRDYHRQFQRVWTWDDSLVDGVHCLKGNTVTDPLLAADFETLKAAFEHRKLLTLIAGAKSSSHPQELYSHRMRTIQWFEASAPQDFDLYGMGWQAEQFPSYRGPVVDKLATLTQYRFCICYENAQGYQGYITEKIIDCLRTGCVPVYGGAPNVARWIPSDCFISVTQFADYFAMYEYLKNMDAATHAGYLDRIARFVTGPDFYSFSIACMVETMTRTLHWDLRGKQPGLRLVQDEKTLRMRVEPDPDSTMGTLAIWMHYDPRDATQQALRQAWHIMATYYPDVVFCVSRHTSDMGRGEIHDNGYDILLGGDVDPTQSVLDFLLRRYEGTLHIFQGHLDRLFDPVHLRNAAQHCAPHESWNSECGTLMGRDAAHALKLAMHTGQIMPEPAPAQREWPQAYAVDCNVERDLWIALDQMRSMIRRDGRG